MKNFFALTGTILGLFVPSLSFADPINFYDVHYLIDGSTAYGSYYDDSTSSTADGVWQYGEDYLGGTYAYSGAGSSGGYFEALADTYTENTLSLASADVDIYFTVDDGNSATSAGVVAVDFSAGYDEGLTATLGDGEVGLTYSLDDATSGSGVHLSGDNSYGSTVNLVEGHVYHAHIHGNSGSSTWGSAARIAAYVLIGQH